MAKLITDKMIDIYEWFSGDVDGYARLSKPEQRRIISDNDFFKLTDFLQSLKMINKNLASDTFKDNIYRELNLICENDLVIKRLENIAKNDKS